ncbi:MAG: bifunctional oligoribonuclease/PAP phosphatase NrnA [Clostridia bacterium]|nr:bifunctional oligoribonuclease/PAP phosphatase NrnA [Clostridia bacterium]
MFSTLLEKIKRYDTVIIHRHKQPDGDAIGSQVGLKLILKENFPEKNIYAVGDDPKRYSFVEGSLMDQIEDEVYKNALAIVLDTSATHLISDDRYKTAEATARVDHHLFVETICDTEIIDNSFESCAGLLGAFVKKTGLKLCPLGAKALFTGMVTDSGRFKYDSVNSQTFEVASFLMTQGFSTADIYTNLYADDFKMIRMRAEFVLKIKFTKNNVAYIVTPLDEFLSLGVDSFTVSRGMVNTMADIKGVNIWVNFTQTEAGVLAELRSSAYDINKIAVKYGGGGHLKASGATLTDLDTAYKMLEDLDALAGELNG